MKTSNKLFVAVVALVLVSLGAYDAALRAEYRTEHYKDPLANYDKQSMAGFDEVTIPAGIYFNARIEAGPAGVWVHKEAASYVRLRRQGHRLTVTVANPSQEHEHFLPGGPAVVIRCPQLQTLTTDASFLTASQRKAHQGEPGGEVLVQNFNQDSLRVSQPWAGTVKLRGNTLRQLRAVAGTTDGSNPTLDLSSTNRIEAADLTVNQHGTLRVGAVIPQLHYQATDGTTVEFGGAMAQQLKR